MKTAKTKDITALVRPEVRKLAAYHVDETPVRIKLDAMENPYPLPPKVLRDVTAAVKKSLINRYPDPSAKELKKAVARMWGMDQDRMIIGNGSDELIQTIVLAFGGPVLIPTPTFAMYEITARALAQEVVTVPLDENFDLDTDAMIRKEKAAKARIIFLACPNNPTGNRFSDKAIRKILDNVNAAVVVDEAYFSFSGKSWLSSLRRYPNLIVLRTLSKIGLAGLRLGVLTASPALIEEFNKIRLPYNINTLSQAAGLTALKDSKVLDRQISLLISERKRLYNALTKLPGIAAFPSETNFILIRAASDATGIFRKLKQQGILIKNLDRPGPLKNCLRVTIGTPKENTEFLMRLKSILHADQR